MEPSSRIKFVKKVVDGKKSACIVCRHTVQSQKQPDQLILVNCANCQLQGSIEVKDGMLCYRLADPNRYWVGQFTEDGCISQENSADGPMPKIRQIIQRADGGDIVLRNQGGVQRITVPARKRKTAPKTNSAGAWLLSMVQRLLP